MAGDNIADYFAPPATPQAQQSLGDMLATTWPARLAKAAFGAVTLPHDVYTGQADMNTDEGFGRAMDLVGLMAGGGVPMAKEGALGAVGGKLRAAPAPQLVTGSMGGVRFELPQAQYETLKAARSAGAKPADIQRMIDEFAAPAAAPQAPLGAPAAAGPSGVKFAAEHPSGASVEKDVPFIHDNGNEYFVDMSRHPAGDDLGATITNASVYDYDLEDFVPLSSLSPVQRHKATKELQGLISEHLQSTAADAADELRWAALPPQQRQAELAADAAATAAQDAAHIKSVNSAVDAALSRGWKPTFNDHGSLHTGAMPPELKDFASPKSAAAIAARMREWGVGAQEQHPPIADLYGAPANGR